MSLDVLTARGQQSVFDETQAATLFVAHHRSYQYVETPKRKPADVDAILMRKGVMEQVVETKCRYDCDYHKFMREYGGQWLVTWEKIEKAKNVARQLCIGLTGFLYIVPSRTLLVQKLMDDAGRLLVPMRLATTETQATTNGGKAVRTNAYIDMRKAKVYRYDEENSRAS